MREVEFFKWYTPGIGGGKPKLTRYEMTTEDAQQRFPGCKPEPTSRIVRRVPETPSEHTTQRCGRDGIG